MQFGDFHGHQALILENNHFRMECLAEAGPRIVRLIPHWTGENLFAEMPKLTVNTEQGEFHYYGGHRLWIAPESLRGTYIPDNHGLSVKQITGGLRLTGIVEPETGLQKSISIQMSSTQAFVMVKHTLENHGRFPVRLAPWALTMMRPSGTAILPQQYGSMDSNELAPNRRFALWSYSRWDDPRLKLGDEFIVIKSDTTSQPLKLGYFNPHGWLGYLYDDVFFVKRFGVRRDEEYADFGSNSEVHASQRAIELQSLGPILTLKPRENVIHTETWEVYKDTEVPNDLLGGRSLDEVLKSRP